MSATRNSATTVSHSTYHAVTRGPRLEGPASICFSGQATFVGELDHGGANLRVDRMIADLPMVREPHQVFAPEPDTRAALLARLDAELSLARPAAPVMPEEAPPGSQ